jgi:hypothetical protein
MVGANNVSLELGLDEVLVEHACHGCSPYVRTCDTSCSNHFSPTRNNTCGCSHQKRDPLWRLAWMGNDEEGARRH